MNLQQFFSSQGYDISEKLNWESYIDTWNSWYKGKVRKFHTYYIYNGQRKVKMEKKSMQGAKKVSEDWADLLYNEKVKINLRKKKETEALEEIFRQNNATVIINKGIEKSFAFCQVKQRYFEFCIHISFHKTFYAESQIRLIKNFVFPYKFKQLFKSVDIERIV